MYWNLLLRISLRYGNENRTDKEEIRELLHYLGSTFFSLIVAKFYNDIASSAGGLKQVGRVVFSFFAITFTQVTLNAIFFSGDVFSIKIDTCSWFSLLFPSKILKNRDNTRCSLFGSFLRSANQNEFTFELKNT